MSGPVAGGLCFHLKEAGCRGCDGMIEADDVIVYIEQDAILAGAFVQLEHVAHTERALKGETI